MLRNYPKHLSTRRYFSSTIRICASLQSTSLVGYEALRKVCGSVLPHGSTLASKKRIEKQAQPKAITPSVSVSPGISDGANAELTKTVKGHVSFSCGVCGKHFKSAISWENHQRIHTGEKPFTCETCGKHFRYSENMTAHPRIHNGQRGKFPCDFCGKVFGGKGMFDLI